MDVNHNVKYEYIKYKSQLYIIIRHKIKNVNLYDSLSKLGSSWILLPKKKKSTQVLLSYQMIVYKFASIFWLFSTCQVN